MRLTKPAKPKKQPFSDEQIRARAYQIWQTHTEHSPQENWNTAIKALQTERLFQPFKVLWQWTGFGEKKLWDFLQLLIVPIVLAGAGFTLQEFAKQREQQAATDKSQQETLVKYLDQMAESIKVDDLLKAKPDKKTFLIAQIRTITALQSLNSDRQSAVIQFLRTADLWSPNYSSRINSTKKKLKRASQQDSYGLFYKARMPTNNLRNADLSDADFRSADLRGANLSGASFHDANLSGANLYDANLSGVSFFGADLRNANINGANLSRADLRGANLNGTNLIFNNLSGANLSDVNLRRIRLDNTNLSGADLSNVNLSGAILITTNLSDANLDGADLSGANLMGANFSGADLKNANLNGVYFCATILSDGKVNNESCPDSK
jgi:uncharacterized protein YjbI with pentapeptide repeats